jgi:SAM-dependent methyltransferase
MVKMARKWRQFYGGRPATVGRTNYLSQVGHTVRGKPIDDVQFMELVAQIRATLQLRKSDVVLDICCGNGVFTQQFAREVASIVGVDFTEELIAIAKADHLSQNIEYFCMNAVDIRVLGRSAERRFTKVLLFASLQHFELVEFDQILKGILENSVERPMIMLGFVPDRALKWRFYRTPRQRLEYLGRRILGADNFGHWWCRRELVNIAARHGLSCEFGSLPASLHAAAYRFNALLYRPAA